jgi:hypothetical protein
MPFVDDGISSPPATSVGKVLLGSNRPAQNYPARSGDSASLIDNTGAVINPSSYPQTLSYNTDGTLASVSFTDGTRTWTQTNTWVNGALTAVSKWVRS